MILYFTGTGNSAFVAHKIANLVQDEEMDLFEKLKYHDYQTIHSDKPFVIVCPTYAWRIPRILEEWLKATVLAGNKKIYFVMTCGGGIANAGYYLHKLCQQKEMEFMGCGEIVMPENYIAMFAVPDKNQAVDIIQKALVHIEEIAQCIREVNKLPKLQVNILDKLSSSIVNKLFYPLFVHSKKFYVTEDCINCGKCVQVCPLDNIHIVDGKPVWNDHCTHCMACICKCPKQAIEYGKKSLGKPRYQCPKL